jgi:hypothetical protein
MKSRIRRKNVRKSIRRCQRGGSQHLRFWDTAETQYWFGWYFGSSSMGKKIFRRNTTLDSDKERRLLIGLTIKEPRKGGFLKEERKEYLYNFFISPKNQNNLNGKVSNKHEALMAHPGSDDDPLIKRFARSFNKTNATLDELVSSFFYNILQSSAARLLHSGALSWDNPAEPGLDDILYDIIFVFELIGCLNELLGFHRPEKKWQDWPEFDRKNVDQQLRLLHEASDWSGLFKLLEKLTNNIEKFCDSPHFKKHCVLSEMLHPPWSEKMYSTLFKILPNPTLFHDTTEW